MSLKTNPRFYQIRAIESKNVMASYIALIYDIEPAQKRLGFELYCIFSNFDDSAFQQMDNAEASVTDQLRGEGQVQTELNGTRSMEQHLLTELMHQAYGDKIETALRKIRP